MERKVYLKASKRYKFVFIFKLWQEEDKTTEGNKKLQHQQILSSAQFDIHWPSDRRLSAWHFRTGLGFQVHLKYGWNIFGRRKSSHIEIKEPDMKSTEFCIRVLGNRYLLVLYDTSGNLLLNGKRLRGETVMLQSGARVGVIIQNEKVIYFEFRNNI